MVRKIQCMVVVIALKVVVVKRFVYIEPRQRDPCRKVHAAASAFSAKPYSIFGCAWRREGLQCIN